MKQEPSNYGENSTVPVTHCAHEFCKSQVGLHIILQPENAGAAEKNGQSDANRIYYHHHKSIKILNVGNKMYIEVLRNCFSNEFTKQTHEVVLVGDTETYHIHDH